MEDENKIIGTICQIRCEHCDEWIKSETHFGDAESYFGTVTIGNKQHCKNCGNMTGMNKDNMRFGERRRDGRITYIEGKDTVF